MRTARGAGRELVLLPVGFLAGAFLAAGRLTVCFAVARAAVVVVVLRDRVLVPPPEPLRAPVVDVLVLRDPGGEDVRVAMVATLGERLSSPLY